MQELSSNSACYCRNAIALCGFWFRIWSCLCKTQHGSSLELLFCRNSGLALAFFRIGLNWNKNTNILHARKFPNCSSAKMERLFMPTLLEYFCSVRLKYCAFFLPMLTNLIINIVIMRDLPDLAEEGDAQTGQRTRWAGSLPAPLPAGLAGRHGAKPACQPSS